MKRGAAQKWTTFALCTLVALLVCRVSRVRSFSPGRGVGGANRRTETTLQASRRSIRSILTPAVLAIAVVVAPEQVFISRIFSGAQDGVIAYADGVSYNYDPSSKDPAGPQLWGEIPNTSCSGSSQSPVDLPSRAQIGGGKIGAGKRLGACTLADKEIVFNGGDYTIGDVKFEVFGHQVKASFEGLPKSPSMVVNGEKYKALQWHTHARSEHTIDGVNADVELHIVHCSENDPGKRAVIGVLLDASSPVDNPWLAPYLDEFGDITAANEARCADKKGVAGQPKRHIGRRGPRANPYDLIPGGASYYAYEGSLTTPPCTQPVKWFVIEAPVRISIKQLGSLLDYTLNHVDGDCHRDSIASPGGDTFRPTQPLNGRVIRMCDMQR